MKTGPKVNRKSGLKGSSAVIITAKKINLVLINFIFRPGRKYFRSNKKSRKQTENLQLQFIWIGQQVKNKVLTFAGLLWHFKADKKLFQLLSDNRSSNKAFVVQKVFLTPLRALAMLKREKNRQNDNEIPLAKQNPISWLT